MVVRLLKLASTWGASASAALLLAVMPAAHGQTFTKAPCSASPCPEVAPAPAPGPQLQAAPAPEPTLVPEQFAATGEGESFAAAVPNLIGDSSIFQTQSVRGREGAIIVRVSSYKVTENASPRPTDRFFLSYNYFHNVQDTHANINREMPGFERAFPGGNASVGMSIPVYQVSGETEGMNTRGWGNLNIIGKYAWINDPSTGNVLSGGLQITLPTGRNISTMPNPPVAQSFNDLVFTPYVGGIYSGSGNFYVQGFSSIAVPTDNRDFVFIFNDLSAGYWLYRTDAGRLNGVVPTLEAHVNTPLNHRGIGSSFGLQDWVVLTMGSHFLFGRSIVTLGIATPITGPQPFDLEAIAQVNFRY